jgi:hypothetical protein
MVREELVPSAIVTGRQIDEFAQESTKLVTRLGRVRRDLYYVPGCVLLAGQNIICQLQKVMRGYSTPSYSSRSRPHDFKAVDLTGL